MKKAHLLHLTSWNEGNGISNNYYLAEEEGSKRAVRFMSNAFGCGSELGTNMNNELVNANGHLISSCSSRR
jgi:hypothetical protein